MDPQPSPEVSELPAAAEARAQSSGGGEERPGLRDSVAAYLAARAELIRLEAAEAARHALRRGMLAGLLACLLLFAWGTILAGLVGMIAAWLEQAGHDVAWYWVALALGVLHLLIAGATGVAISRPSPPPFETTRTELEKDRQWLENLGTRSSSRR